LYIVFVLYAVVVCVLQSLNIDFGETDVRFGFGNGMILLLPQAVGVKQDRFAIWYLPIENQIRTLVGSYCTVRVRPRDVVIT
jgi:hypothetical protein